MKNLKVHERIYVEPLLLSPTAAFMLANPDLRKWIGGVCISPPNFTRTIAYLLGRNEGTALELTTGMRMLSEVCRPIFWNEQWYGNAEHIEACASVLFHNMRPKYVSVSNGIGIPEMKKAAEVIHVCDSQMILLSIGGTLLGSELKRLGVDGFICTPGVLEHLKRVGTYDQFTDFTKFVRVVTSDAKYGAKAEMPTPADAVAAGADIILVTAGIPLQENHRSYEVQRIAGQIHEEVRQAFIDNGREDEIV